MLEHLELLNGHFKLLRSIVSPSSSPYPTLSVSTFKFLCQGKIAIILGSMWPEHHLYAFLK